MPTPVLLLLAAALLPLGAFGVLASVGRRMGNPIAGIFGTLAVGGSFICSIAALVLWLSVPDHSTWGARQGPVVMIYPWIPAGRVWLDVGLYVDSLTITMFATITLVAALVHLFSIGYMRADGRFPRFFTYLSLFCFSMLGLVLSGTLLQMFVFWELVGLCSYLLIGFWYEKPTASNAAIKAFVMNRVGDAAFLVGLGLLFYHVGNLTLPDLWITLRGAAGGGGIGLPDGGTYSPLLLTLTGIMLFGGAVAKSAQFPLHTWLADAMEGPTPVSALIHAATMVAAGVYLVGRIFPILTPDARLFIAVIGVVTLTTGALIALAQSDIKKVLAYSTVSQLGYMILALGLGSWVGGLFHLITHAFFKACLFLGAGSVIDAAHHEQEMARYGGLVRKIPVTAFTFAVAVLAISGAPFFAGSYSKDLILAHAGAFGYLAEGTGASGWYWAFFVMPTAVAYVTAFYMTRCWMLTFAGRPRDTRLHEAARERPMLYGPLVVLALLSTFVGGYLLGVRELLQRSVVEANRYAEVMTGTPGVDLFSAAWPVDSAPPVLPGESLLMEPTEPHVAGAASLVDRGQHLAHDSVGWAWLVGIALGVGIYSRGLDIPRMAMKLPPVRWTHAWLYRRMYLDELYVLLFVRAGLGVARLVEALDRRVIDGAVHLVAAAGRGASRLAGWHDRYVIDGSVSGVVTAAHALGAAVRAPQTGRIRLYVLVLLAGLTLAAAVAVLFVLASP